MEPGGPERRTMWPLGIPPPSRASRPATNVRTRASSRGIKEESSAPQRLAGEPSPHRAHSPLPPGRRATGEEVASRTSWPSEERGLDGDHACARYLNRPLRFSTLITARRRLQRRENL